MIRLEINKRFAKIITILVIGLVLFLFNTDLVSANTGINPQIPYSGTIVKNDGTVLSDGTYRAKFLLYNVVSGGTAIYEEVRDGNTSYAGTGVSPALTVSDGRFEILLGSQNTNFTSILNDDSLWLELQLDLDNNSVYEEVFSPRRRIGSSVYSINSLRLVAANGGTDTDTLSLDISGNVIATSLGGGVNASTPGGFDRVIIANSSGQFSQVNISALSGGSSWALAGNSTTDAWNGSSGTRLGTTSAQPLVLATTNATAQDIRFFTGANGANERMRITGNGNVGIGTATPAANLDVNGTSVFRGQSTFRDQNPELIAATAVGWRGTVYQSGIGGGLQNVFQRADGTEASPTNVKNSMSLGSLSFRGYDGTGFTGSKAYISASASQDWTATANGTSMTFQTTENNTTTGQTRIFIANNGNVGIGTFSTGSRLVVQSSGSTSATSSLNILNSSSSSILFSRDDGNVGIGTTTPGSLLQVNGGAAIGYSASTVAPTNGLLVSGIITPSVGSSNGIDWPNDPFGGTGDDAWIRYYSDNGTTEDMKLQIGTSNDAQDDIDFIQSGASRLSIENGNVSIPNGNFGVNNRIGVGVAAVSTTARLHIGAGTATANTAPIKFTAGTNLTTPESGAMEWDGTNLFLTNSSSTRQTINQGLTATATLDFPSTNNDSFNNLTVTVTGAVVGDVVTLGLPNGSVPAAASNFTSWVSAANTVTVRFSNHSGVAQDPASGSFKIFVTKF